MTKSQADSVTSSPSDGEFKVVACQHRKPQVQITRNNRRWITIHMKDFGEAVTLAHVIVEAAPELLETMARIGTVTRG